MSTDLSKLAESEKNYEQASRILARLIKDHKLIPHYREEMAVTLCGRAAVRLAMTRIPDAQRDCEAALDHLAWLIGEQTRKGAPENPAVSQPSRPGPGSAEPDSFPPEDGRQRVGRPTPKRSKN